MKLKHTAIVLALVVGTVVAGIGLVSGAHDPANPDDFYIHKVDQVAQGSNAQICITSLGPDVNKVLIEGETTHQNTTFFHDGPDGDVRINVPELNVPPENNIILYSNGENPTIDNAATDGGTCLPPGQGTTDTLNIGEYNINVGHITLTQGVTIVTGPNVSDNRPPPGSGSGGFGLSSGSDSSDEPAIDPDPNDTDDVDVPDVTGTPEPDLGNTDEATNGTTEDVTDTVEETEEEADTIVEHIQETFDETLDSLFGDESGSTEATEEFTDGTGTTGSTVGSTGSDTLSGAFGVTGVVGLLGLVLGFVRHWSS